MVALMPTHGGIGNEPRIQSSDCLELHVDLAALAERVGTPLHAYSAPAIEARCAELQRALRGLDALACYAVKANGSMAVLRLMAEAGFGADIVS